ncbi:hypothetical protein [Methylobacterium sp. NEAU K]|uniref:hypothetical protein n=1 Tax=Methylobacterium sp. NEAU K TaxID=3064946 RepID=UPI002732325E|nr:hypothetical protein [Methylobacterium sp. NEAU K]MDP4006818.1 hypothetical protein [Methylobacterium sp. NEAU K]
MSGLLRSHIVDRVSIEHLAHDFGYTPARLRTLLLNHLGACLAALAIEVPDALEPQAHPPEVGPTARRRLRL